MERTLFLFALSSLLVCSFALTAVDVNTFSRPSEKLGNGTISCAGVPQSGSTVTVECTDGAVTGTLQATTDAFGFFSLEYYTDFPQYTYRNFVMANPKAATCKIVSIEPPTVSTKMICPTELVDGTCTIDASLTNAPLLKNAVNDLEYIASHAGCFPKQPDPKILSADPTGPACSKSPRQILDPSVKIFAIQEMMLNQPPVEYSASEDACANKCKITPGCNFYSWNNCGTSCTFYPAGAIATNPAALRKGTGYEISSGEFICPTILGGCN